MTRVIAGTAGGRRLAVPPGQGTRPTSDRAREGLLSSWLSLYGPLEGARVLDLFGGSGAVGLEALSRGAARLLVAESDQRAVRVIRDNVRVLGLPGAQVWSGRAEKLIAGPPPCRFELVFLDPPYAVGDAAVREILITLRDGGWLAPDAVLTVERAARGGEFSWPAGFAALRVRRYGEAALWYGRAATAPGDPDHGAAGTTAP